MGKVLSGIGQRAAARGVPVVAISGGVQPGAENLYENGLTALFSACRRPASLEQAIQNAGVNIETTAEDVFRLIRAFEK
jgi:glycerate kinase